MIPLPHKDYPIVTNSGNATQDMYGWMLSVSDQKIITDAFTPVSPLPTNVTSINSILIKTGVIVNLEITIVYSGDVSSSTTMGNLASAYRHSRAPARSFANATTDVMDLASNGNAILISNHAGSNTKTHRWCYIAL